MKISKLLMAVGLLAALGFSGVASAHDYTGALGSAAGATDRWYFVCSAGMVSLTYHIQRTAGRAAQVKVKFDTTGIVSGPTTGTAAVTAFSPLKTAATRAAVKFFTITKTAAGAVNYRVRAHCINASGTYYPEDQSAVQTYIQNQ